MKPIMKYTKYDHITLEHQIDVEIRSARTAVLKFFGGYVKGVWLIGGYGRGEGGVLINGHNVSPKNNYDFLVIYEGLTKDMINEKSNKVQDFLQGKLSVKLEMSFRSMDELKLAPHLLIYKDILKMGKCLFGVKPIDILSRFDGLELDKSEALKVIRNRGMLWIALRDKIGHLSYDCTQSQRQVWLNKVILGYLDAILIVEGEYVVGYCEKLNKLKSIMNRDSIMNAFDAEYFLDLVRKSLISRFYDISYDFDSQMIELERILYSIHCHVSREVFQSTNRNLTLKEYTGAIGFLKSMVRSVQTFGVVGAVSSFFIHPVDQLNKYCSDVFYKNVNKDLDKKIFSPYRPLGKISIRDLTSDLMKIYIKHLV